MERAELVMNIPTPEEVSNLTSTSNVELILVVEIRSSLDQEDARLALPCTQFLHLVGIVNRKPGALCIDKLSQTEHVVLVLHTTS